MAMELQKIGKIYLENATKLTHDLHTYASRPPPPTPGRPVYVYGASINECA